MIHLRIWDTDTFFLAATRLAYAAQRSYVWTGADTEAGTAAIRHDLADNFPRFAVFRGAVEAAALASRDDQILIAIPGSELDLHDWLANFTARQVYVDGLGLVHAGFWRYAQSLWINFIAPQLRSTGVAGKSIYLTGHSQGGAVAAIIAALLRRDFQPARLVATFGAPRFMSPDSVASYRENLYSFRNRGDVVPTVPWGLLTTYANAGESLYLANDGRLLLTAPHWWEIAYYAWRRLKTAVGLNDVEGPLRSHSMKEYLERMTAAKWPQSMNGRGF